jgi:xanthine dehydrogenase accessory factor
MQPHRTWFEELAALRAEGRACAMVVVTEVRGSAPREVGARLIVAGGELVWGTIGGGKLEHLAIARASELISTGRAASESRDYPLAESAGQCCGGAVTLFYEVFPWTARRVVVFGAGHVAQALAGLSGYLGAELELIDPREESDLQPVPPTERPWTLTSVDAPEDEVARLAPDSLVLVMTHDHALDQTLLEELLRRGGFPYVGLIGSERKWARFRKRLAARGFDELQLASVTCPIGTTKSSKEPTAIAISVAAELLEVMASLAGA